jgi:hypothetical protein
MKLFQTLEFTDNPRSVCWECKYKIEKDAITSFYKDPLSSKSSLKYFHMNCYSPIIKLPYEYKENYAPEIKEFIIRWNLQFKPIDIKNNAPNALFQFKNFRFSRIWIETFKFLTPGEVTKLSSVSKVFYMYTWNIEIWKEITKISGNTVNDIKFLYLKKTFNSCTACGETNMQQLYKNLLLNRCLCFSCHVNPYLSGGSNKYCLKLVKELLKRYRINRSFLDQNNIPVLIGKDFCHRTYPILIEKALENKTSHHYDRYNTRKKRKLAD